MLPHSTRLFKATTPIVPPVWRGNLKNEGGMSYGLPPFFFLSILRFIQTGHMWPLFGHNNWFIVCAQKSGKNA